MEKFTYIANNRIPTKFAYGVQIMKMCEAFADAGFEVELVLPKRWQKIKADPFDFYGVKRNFVIRKLWTLDLVRLRIPFFFQIEIITFSISVLLFLLRKESGGILYTRGEMVTILAHFSHKFKVFWETHNKPDRMKRYKGALKKIHGIIVLTDYYKQELVHEYGIPSTNVLVMPDGVDKKALTSRIDTKKARKILDIPQNKHIVMYTGSDVEWKDLQVLRKAGTLLPDDYLVYFVGNIQQKNSTDKKLQFPGFQTPKDIPLWLAAADVCVLTESASSPIALRYTSPLKAFEYMAAKKPIVASNTPAIREILNDQTSILTKAGDAHRLAQAIQRVINNPGLQNTITQQALLVVREFTWNLRAEKIRKFILGNT